MRPWKKKKLSDRLTELSLKIKIALPLRQLKAKFPDIARIAESARHLSLKTFSKQARIINECKIFDSDWYTSQYLGTRNSEEDPLKHFLCYGVFEDWSPHPLFDVRWYRNFYGLDKNVNPLIHFIANSKKLYYNPNAFFDVKSYAENYMKREHPTALEVVDHYYTQGEKHNKLPSENFEPAFYAESCADARDFQYGLLAHYIVHGRTQKKLPFNLRGQQLHPLCVSLQQVDLDNIVIDDTLSQYFDTPERIKEFFSSCTRFPEDIPLQFSPHNYVKYNSDLKAFENEPLEAIRHFFMHGFKENRMYKEVNFEQNVDNFYSILNISKREFSDYRPSLKTCVLVHIYYFEVYGELKYYIRNLSGLNYDIYFNLVENNWTINLHKLIANDFPEAKIIVSQNRGKDIGGVFNLLSYIKDIQSYDAFLLLHSKKSPHIPEVLSNKWRKDLLEAAIGSREIVLQNMYLMERYRDTGLIGSRFWRDRYISGNTAKYFAIMKVLEISKNNYHCDYLSGTMMWLNSKVLDHLYSKCNRLEFEDGNDKSLEFHRDGQFAHAIERAFGNICRQLSLNMFFR